MSSAPQQLRSAKRDADRWFREQGLPTFVPLRRWFTDLPRRVAPLIVWVTLAFFLLSDGIDDAVDVALEVAIDDETVILIVVAIVLLIGVAIAWGGYLLARWVLRRLPVGIGTVVASVLIVGCSASLIVGGYMSTPHATVGPVLKTLGVVALCILITGAGGGALVSWASKLAVRNASAIGHMASIALPVILMLVVFAFFSAEVWQMASALPWGSLWLLGLVVGALAVLVVLRVSASEIDDETHSPTPEQCVEMLAGTPAEGRMPGATGRAALRAPQRINILLAMTFAQLLQALFFAALLCALLVVIGSIAIPRGVVELWVGAGTPTLPLTVEQLAIGDTPLPITVNLIKAAALLSLIATLPFVFSAVSEQRYRERFFDPIMADMRRAIIVRGALVPKARRAPRDGDPSAP